MEQELLNSIRDRGKYSLENDVSNSKALLCRQIGRNGDNLYNLLLRLVSRLLDHPPANVVDHFEEYCRLAQMDFLSSEGHFHRKPMQPDASAQKQYTHAQHILNALTQIETEKIRLHPELSLQIKRGLNTMGRDLPYGYDYFISAQIERTLRNVSEVTSCQFWGVVRALDCDYYILELEHREKSVDYCAQRGVVGRQPEIVTDIVAALLDDTIQKTNPPSDAEQTEGLDAEPLETIKELTRPILMNILEGVEQMNREIEQDHCQNDMSELLTELIIDRLSLETTRSSTTVSSVSDLSDPCGSETHRAPKESTASLQRARLERLQVEVRLNSRSYLVSENPCTKPWQRLPPVTIEQLKAIEGLRVFLAGNLKAKVRQVGQPFDGLEENLLRALIAKISAHRDHHIDGSETNISLVKCLSGMNDSVTGYNHALLMERNERWCKRNEHGMQYWTSEIWPGLRAFSDGEQYRCYYFGWGLERLTHWYSPIVRIPEMQEEYVAELNQNGDYKQDTELQTELNQSFDILHESKE